jgi:hypothetical protein
MHVAIDQPRQYQITAISPFRFCPLKKRISAPRGRHIDEMRLEL